MDLVIIPIALIGLWSVALIVNPRLGWQLSRWQYRNPEAVEPSDAALLANRIGGVVGVLIAIGGSWWSRTSAR